VRISVSPHAPRVLELLGYPKSFDRGIFRFDSSDVQFTEDLPIGSRRHRTCDRPSPMKQVRHDQSMLKMAGWAHACHDERKSAVIWAVH
jgi:hypothetical protein